jgi:hypothetical protein
MPEGTAVSSRMRAARCHHQLPHMDSRDIQSFINKKSRILASLGMGPTPAGQCDVRRRSCSQKPGVMPKATVDDSQASHLQSQGSRQQPQPSSASPQDPNSRPELPARIPIPGRRSQETAGQCRHRGITRPIQASDPLSPQTIHTTNHRNLPSHIPT